MLKLTLKLLPGMFRQSTFMLLLLSLIVATATVVSIGVFVERISQTLYDEASQFIAADARINGSRPVDPVWLDSADENRLETSELVGFSAMAFAGDAMQLTQVKAVDNEYPLRGTLTISKTDREKSVLTLSGPSRGEIWLAPRLMGSLNVSVGDFVQIGEAKLKIAAILLKEPDSAQSMFGVAPRVMMHYDDVVLTNAVQVGSRVSYAALFAGEVAALEEFKRQVRPNLGEHHRWISPEDGNAAFTTTVKRAKRFLLLSGSLSVLLACVAIALSSHRFAHAQYGHVALLKTLGLTPGNIQYVYLNLLAALFLLGFALGASLGFALHHTLIWALSDLLPENLADSGIQPYITGALTTLVSLFAFAAPSLVALKYIAPTQILRRQSELQNTTLLSSVIGVMAASALIGFYSQDIVITLIMLAGLVVCVSASTGATFLLLALIKRAQNTLHGAWRLGVSGLQRQRRFTALQVFVFSTVGMLTLILFQVRTSLVNQWQPGVQETPNHFAFNIFDSELEAVKRNFIEQEIDVSAYYPMTRGRLIKVNDDPVKQIITGRAQRTEYERELNLTWSGTLGGDNKIEQGQWWSGLASNAAGGELKVSIEQDYAEGLGVGIGDVIHLSISDQPLQAHVSSIRSVQWDSMNPNFYLIFDRPLGANYPVNWVTSFYLSPDRKPLLNTLAKTFPTISFIELDQTLALIKDVVGKVSQAVEFILLLVLAAASLVMLTSIHATMSQRKKESALIRSFGAQTHFIQKIMMVEFIGIGVIAGFFACVGAEFCLYVLQTRLFDMPFRFHLTMWLVAPAMTVAFIVVVGLLATWSAARIPPLRVLRHSD